MSAMTRRSLLALPFAGAGLAQTLSRPNVLLILVDDMGQRALSCYGNPHVQTVNIDRLAKEGVRFTDAYATPQCTPTRATLLTGQYTARNRMWHVIPGYGHPRARMEEPRYLENLDRGAFTLAKGMRSAGYRTACIGKWHLTTNNDGNYGALKAEAADYYGFDYVGDAPPPRETATGDKGVDRLTAEAIRFMKADRTKPFFCYLAHHTTHGPLVAPRELVEKYKSRGLPEEGENNAVLMACLEHLDRSVGRLLAALEEMGIGKSTAVFFIADNGGVWKRYRPVLAADAKPSPKNLTLMDHNFTNAPFREGKGSAYEGGVRVPWLVRWPGVVSAGQVNATPVHVVDLMPTLFDMAGARAPQGYTMDGVSLSPVLRGGALRARALYWYMPFYDLRWAAVPSAVIREGDFKLIESFGDHVDLDRNAAYTTEPRLELFNLRKDPGERDNLAAAMPERARAMQAKLRQWIAACGATIPGRNARFDAARALWEQKGQSSPPVTRP